MENEIIPPEAPNSWQESKFYKNFTAIAAVGKAIGVILILVFGYYLYQRDINAQQAINAREFQDRLLAVEKKLVEAQANNDDNFKKVLTRELYEAYHRNDVEKMDRIERLINREPPLR